MRADDTWTGPTERLDRAVAAFAGISRRAAREAIASGRVFVNGRRCRVASRPIEEHTRIVVHPPDVSAESGSIRVLYEDEH
ncbi:MAG: hypothetical protein HC923_11640 [Myxococcales bacterium]|nr:hypothetical protein [Myxococcales bacterium]